MTREVPVITLSKMSSPAKRSRTDAFLCPISHEVMRDPVITSDGHTYDRSSINRVFETSLLSPNTGLQLPDRRLLPNIALRRAMGEAGITDLVPIVYPGPTTPEQAAEYAKEMIARSPSKESKHDWENTYKLVEQCWRDALRDAFERGDFFVLVNVTNHKKSGALKTGAFAKLGPGVQLLEMWKTLKRDGIFINRLPLVQMLSACARSSGFHASRSWSVGDSVDLTGFLACHQEEDIEEAMKRAQKYR